jgi:phosphoribosylanthranilate isomerase
MTNLEDALAAVEAGADAVGFVFYEKSPRNVAVETAREIVEKLPDGVEKVGVFVDHSAEQITGIAERVGLSALQLYPLASDAGVSIKDYPANGGRRLFVAIGGERVASGEDVGALFPSECSRKIDALFLDSGNSQQAGGTGRTFDWASAANAVKAMNGRIPVVIAGGLTAENVGEAIRILKPWGVDVVSGVEARPGKKDPGKVRAFVRAVRQAEDRR